MNLQKIEANNSWSVAWNRTIPADLQTLQKEKNAYCRPETSGVVCYAAVVDYYMQYFMILGVKTQGK